MCFHARESSHICTKQTHGQKTTWNLTDLFISFQHSSESEFQHLKCHFLSWPLICVHSCSRADVVKIHPGFLSGRAWSVSALSKTNSKKNIFFFCFSHCRQLIPFTSLSFRASLPTVSIVYCCKRIRRTSNSSGTLRPAVASWHTPCAPPGWFENPTWKIYWSGLDVASAPHKTPQSRL